MKRRDFLLAGSAALIAGGSAQGRQATPVATSTMGIVEHSYAQRQAVGRENGGKGLLDDPAAFLELCHERGAAGIQMSLADKRLEAHFPEKLQRVAREHKMFFEASCELPRNRTQLDRLVEALVVCSEFGATVVRVVAMPGRRYERFKEAAAFRAAAEQAFQSLLLVKDVLERHQFKNMRIAVENHKDWRSGELVEMLQRLNSPNIGVCLDTGNSVALLEDPMETVETLAPWAFTTHLKDMGVEEYADGFLLSEVPLGKGFLDLPKIVSAIRKERPEIRFNLEMMTRDPLKIPCLTQGYWAVLDGMSGWPLARTMKMVRAHASKTPLARVSGLDAARRVQLEDENVRESLTYARERLGLTA